MSTDLLSELTNQRDPSWILRTGGLFAAQPERWLALRKEPAYNELCLAAQDQATSCKNLPPAVLRVWSTI